MAASQQQKAQQEKTVHVCVCERQLASDPRQMKQHGRVKRGLKGQEAQEGQVWKHKQAAKGSQQVGC